MNNTCPTCGAPPGTPCMTPKGATTTEHQQRSDGGRVHRLKRRAAQCIAYRRKQGIAPRNFSDPSRRSA